MQRKYVKDTCRRNVQKKHVTEMRRRNEQEKRVVESSRGGIMQDLSFRRKRRNSRRRSRNGQRRTSDRQMRFAGNLDQVQVERKRRKQHKKDSPAKKAVLWGAEIILVCLAAFMLVSMFGMRVSTAGDSMSPALENGDVVLTDRLIYNITKPGRGDIIAYRREGSGHYSLKRVVGLPGETVQIKNGRVYINGKNVKKGIELSNIDFAGIAEEPVELASDEYFVIGDNHSVSDDSRSADIGCIKRKEIYGKAWYVIDGDRKGLL